MRLLDHDEPIDPEVAAVLDAIDGVLAGEPVDAQYAEMAEITLLLAADRPAVPDTLARSLDERVASRFAPAPAAVSPSRRRRLSAGFWEATGALAAAVGLIVAIVVVAGGGHGASSASSSSASASSGGTASSAAGASSAGAATTASTPTQDKAQVRSAASGAVKAQPAEVPPTGAPNGSFSSPQPLKPPTTGRKVVQGAQLNLAAAPNRIDDVSQQVYDVVGAVNGIVENSTVTQTGGTGGYADFQLSIPSGSLGQAMTRLSSLTYAQVVSRTDSSQDITDQYGAAQRRLADARALRTSLLKQLANATTTEQIDSLKAQIRDAEASISSNQATLNRMNRQVGFSQLSLQIGARSPAPTPTHHGGGFGIGSAAHDAGRVLTVVAGAALITLAALTPVALLGALAWWVGAGVRRRRREQALDAA